MKVILFGATGMVGQGVLRECLLADDIKGVLTIGRSSSGQRHPKLRERLHTDLFDYSAIESDLHGFDACFFCLGVSAAGLSEAEYTRINHDLTLAAAQTLVRLNPKMTFIYVSGAGTDSTERGRTMWARVKGKTENDLLRCHLKLYIYSVQASFSRYMAHVLRRPRIGSCTRYSSRCCLYSVHCCPMWY